MVNVVTFRVRGDSDNDLETSFEAMVKLNVGKAVVLEVSEGRNITEAADNVLRKALSRHFSEDKLEAALAQARGARQVVEVLGGLN